MRPCPPCLFLFVLMCHYQAIQSELALDVAPDVVVTAQIKSVPRTAKVIFFLKDELFFRTWFIELYSAFRGVPYSSRNR